MIYKTAKEIRDTGKTEFWAYAYFKCYDNVSNALIAHPYKCKISLNSNCDWRSECFKLGKKGQVLKSGAVSFSSREYADTYEEAIAGFNQLVDESINTLVKFTIEIEADKIR